MQESPVRFLGWEDPLEKEWLPTPVFSPGEFHELDPKELDTTERLSLSFMVHQTFFQLLTLMETWLPLKITEHVVHDLYSLQPSTDFCVILPHFLKVLASGSLSLSPIPFP